MLGFNQLQVLLKSLSASRTLVSFSSPRLVGFDSFEWGNRDRFDGDKEHEAAEQSVH